MNDGRHERDEHRDLEDGVGVEGLAEEEPRDDGREANREGGLLVPRELRCSVVPEHHDEGEQACERVDDPEGGLHQVTAQGAVGEGIQGRREGPESPRRLAGCALLLDRFPVVHPERP